MSKATIEFTPLSVFPLTLPANPSVDAGVRLLSHAHRSGDKTLVLYHPPGQEWEGDGGSNTQAAHTYWEEVLILKGKIYDKTLKQWFGAHEYSCRPPGQLHGPWTAGPEGCEEIVWTRYP